MRIPLARLDLLIGLRAICSMFLKECLESAAPLSLVFLRFATQRILLVLFLVKPYLAALTAFLFAAWVCRWPKVATPSRVLGSKFDGQPETHFVCMS